MSKPTDKQPSELSVLRAEYKELAGKNPSPSLNAEKLIEKIAELKAAQDAPPAQDQGPAMDPDTDQTPPAQDLATGNDDEQPGQDDDDDGDDGDVDGQNAQPSLSPDPGPVVVASAESDEPSDEGLAEMGLEVGEDGLCGLTALTSMSGPDVSIGPGEAYRRRPAIAVRHIRHGLGRVA